MEFGWRNGSALLRARLVACICLLGAGRYTGSLSNAGERIELRDAAGKVIHSFRYEDNWYKATDGAGFSLPVVDPATADHHATGIDLGLRPHQRSHPRQPGAAILSRLSAERPVRRDSEPPVCSVGEISGLGLTQVTFRSDEWGEKGGADYRRPTLYSQIISRSWSPPGIYSPREICGITRWSARAREVGPGYGREQRRCRYRSPASTAS